MRRNPLRGPNWLIWLAIIVFIIVFLGMTYAKAAIDKAAEADNISRLKRLEQKFDKVLKKSEGEQQKLEEDNKKKQMTIDQLQQENARYREEVGRIEAIRDYLASYSSPLADYAGPIYRACKKHGVKPAVILAIAGKESTFGRANGIAAAWALFGWSGRLDESSPEALIDSYVRAIANEYPRLAQGDIYSATSYCVPPDDWMRAVSSFYNEAEARGV
ncbi:MAG: hypothetical protein WC891_02840 [Actinomycetota bacterium]